MDDLFMAIYEEHKQRTRHDVFTQRRLSTLCITCDVCLYLDRLKQKYEKEESEYHKREQAEYDKTQAKG